MHVREGTCVRHDHQGLQLGESSDLLAFLLSFFFSVRTILFLEFFLCADNKCISLVRLAYLDILKYYTKIKVLKKLNQTGQKLFFFLDFLFVNDKKFFLLFFLVVY